MRYGGSRFLVLKPDIFAAWAFRKTPFVIGSVVIMLAASDRSCSFAMAQPSPDVRAGVVGASDGRVLSLVWVQELGAWSGTLTKADGRFLFPANKAVTLLFFKNGFRPELRVITGSADRADLSVVLEPEPAVVPVLRSRGRGGGTQLHELEPARVRGLHLKRGYETDFVGYSATYSYGGSIWDLGSMTGIHVPGLTPEPGWISGLGSFTVRSLHCGGAQWIDLRGTSAQGLLSRWIGYAFGHVEYSRVSLPVAVVFDKAIENGWCFRS